MKEKYMKEKDLKKSKKLLINRVASKDDEEDLKKLKELKKKIKKVKTIEELEEIEGSLEKMGILDELLARLDDKKKKKRRKTDREIFEERVRVNLDIINRTVLVGKLFKSKERDRKLEGLLNKIESTKEHDSEIPADRIRDKDKEHKKEMEERENQAKKKRERGERSR